LRIRVYVPENTSGQLFWFGKSYQRFWITTESKVNSKYRSYYDGGNNEKICYDKTLTESRNINDIRPERCKGRLTNIPVMPVATKVMDWDNETSPLP
jgi:hypothetical protein